jgi:2-methylcitrate dehydratase PrpD
MPSDDLRDLADFTAATSLATVPAAIVEKAKSCLLYGISVGIATVGAEQPHDAARALDAEDDGAPARGATRLIDGASRGAGAAAFANAVLFHARCQEDAHPAGHVGAVVLPAALAATEHRDCSGADLISAIVAGYEVALRIGRDHAADLSIRGFRTTPAYGVFGAAAAAARIARLDGARTMDALGLAANVAAGLREFVQAGSEDFPYQAGFAARNGITCASLAAAGVRSAPTALSGAAGFFAAFAGDLPKYGARLTHELGLSFEMDTIAYKPYPICQFHRGIVRGLCELRREAAGVPMAKIDIHLNPIEAEFWGVRYAGPFRRFPQTFMSAPFCAALAWSSGSVTFAALHDFDAAAVLALIPRIKVIADERCGRYRPSLSVDLGDGRALRWNEATGADAYRLDWTIARQMARTLCAEAGVENSLIERLVESAAAVDQAEHIGYLVATLRDAIGMAVGARQSPR